MAKNKREETKKYPIYAFYEESSHGGGVCAGDENESWPNYEDEFTEFRLKSVSLNGKESFYKETIELDWEPKVGDKVFILVVRYGSGCTFGRTYGHFHFCGAFKTEEELLSYKLKLENYDKNSQYDMYRPWVGYFECLEGWEIYECNIGNSVIQSNMDSNTKRFSI